jgi:hypothetical protein
MRNAQTPLRSQGACPTQTGSSSALEHKPSGASFFPDRRTKCSDDRFGHPLPDCYRHLLIHESRPVFTDAPHPESQLAISGDLARIEARYWLLLLGSGCVVGNPYLGITSGLPVTRQESCDGPERHYPKPICKYWPTCRYRPIQVCRVEGKGRSQSPGWMAQCYNPGPRIQRRREWRKTMPRSSAALWTK